MGPRQRQREQHLRDEIAVARDVEGVGGDRPETERFLEEHPVHREPGAGECPRAQRQLGHPAPCVGQTLPVAHQRPGVRQQHERPPDGLRPLAVGVSGEDDVDAFPRARDERPPQGGEIGVEMVDRIEGPEPQIGGDLVVA